MQTIRVMLSVMMSLVMVNHAMSMEESLDDKKKCSKLVVDLFKTTQKPTKEQRDDIFNCEQCRTFSRGELYEESDNVLTQEINNSKNAEINTLKAVQEIHARSDYYKNGTVKKFVVNCGQDARPLIKNVVIPSMFHFSVLLGGKFLSRIKIPFIPTWMNPFSFGGENSDEGNSSK